MVTMTHRFDAQSLVDTYMSLPVKQRKHLERKAQSYIQALDQAIIQVLSPTIGKSDDQFLVTDDVIPLYGLGLSSEEAMADYRSVVVEYYESLEEDAEELEQALREQLRLLRQVFSLLEKVS